MAKHPWAGGFSPVMSPHAHLVLLATAASVGSPILPVAAGGDMVGRHVVVVLLGGPLCDDACECKREVPAVSQGLRGWGRAALYPTALYSQLE